MPMRIDMSPDGTRNAGVDITWTPSQSRLDVRVWDDSMVQVGVTSLSLNEFFARFKITEADCRKAFAQIKRRNAT